MRLPGMGSHESTLAISDEWMTPPRIVRALGDFDLDPCSPVDRPWDTAARHLTMEDDGLDSPWGGRVFLNPPYSEVERWMARMASHGRGTALVFARVETTWWFDHVWPKASAILFPRSRIRFMRADGTTPPAGSGAPSALVAYGSRDAHLLAAEMSYREAKARAWVATPRTAPDGKAVPAKEREALVDAATAKDRRARDLADSMRQAALEAVRSRRGQISALQSLLAAERAEAGLARYGPE